MANYGVIDLGSNTIRLCIYEVKDDTKSSYTKRDVQTLLNNKVMAGLAAYVHGDTFTHGGVRRAVDVLKGHQKRLKYFNCKKVEAFATAALRDVSNSAAAVAAIEEASGLQITVLPALEEAHLGFVGASSESGLGDATLLDIGGGSTELTRVRNHVDANNASLALGSLSSYTNHVKSILPTRAELRHIASDCAKRLRSLHNYKAYRHEVLYGIGGSVRATSKVYTEAFGLHERLDVLKHKQVKELLDQYSRDPVGFAHHILQAAPERIHTMIPGCCIVHTLMEELGAAQLVLCSNGVREGYLIERMLEGTVEQRSA